MKKKVSLILVWLAIGLVMNGQIPQKFKYQAVVRDNQHVILSNQDVGFRMSILKGNSDGTEIYSESQVIKTNPFGIADITIGDGEVVSGVFSDISWGSDNYYLKVEADPKGGSVYEYLGTTQLISVPYALYSGNISSPTRKFTIQEEAGHPLDSALFEVRNADGQTVFAVYPEGTRVNILDEQTKGIKAGFAVGGYNRTGKGVTQEYMRITPDSIRLYFNEESTKGIKGGFAVGGYNRTGKGPIDHYFELKPDSAKFLLVSENPEESSNTALTVETKSRSGGDDKANLFYLTQDNYFVGHRSGSSNTSGWRNCFIGYESGLSNTNGYHNSFIGFESGKSNTTGNNNLFLGPNAGRNNTTGGDNIAIGLGAGENSIDGSANTFIGVGAGLNNVDGSHNIFIGTDAGHRLSGGNSNTIVGSYSGEETTSGIHNAFFGMRAGNMVGSDFNTMIGAYTGADSNNGGENVFVGSNAGRAASGQYNTYLGSNSGIENKGGENTFIGHGAGALNMAGSNNVFIGMEAGSHNNGTGNVFIGRFAGQWTEGSNMLMIDNSPADSSQSLIWGRFDEKILRLNNRLGIGRNPENVALEVEGDAYKTSGSTNWEVTSDARVKTDIRTIENGLEQILKLRPVTFRYTDQWRESNPGVSKQEFFHYIAQEFAEVFPGSVHHGPDTLPTEEESLLRMDSQPAQVVAIRAIQELAEQNRMQQVALKKLQEENEALRQTTGKILEWIELSERNTGSSTSGLASTIEISN